MTQKWRSLRTGPWQKSWTPGAKTELVRFAAEEAVQSELASQAETRPGGGTPVSVGGGSHSVAHDAEVALLAYRSVQEVLSVVAERPEPERPPQRPVERPARPPPERPERPARREPERPEQPVAPVRPAGQDQDRTIIDAPTSATISQRRNVRPVIQRSGSVLVDPNLTAQLCSLLNAPETPPGEDARMCREPLPRRARNPETPPGEEARMRREPLQLVNPPVAPQVFLKLLNLTAHLSRAQQGPPYEVAAPHPTKRLAKVMSTRLWKKKFSTSWICYVCRLRNPKQPRSSVSLMAFASITWNSFAICQC
ncbi:unnamed protein product [Durusdinium trenchii]|uniref:Uncharacterized protein n=1 Tax=Durusdinium trenchii TaxID=1381693 RepID=A0ABP0NL18_9DINO